MSMPTIDSSTIEREQSVTDIIQSVALEQTALSHILNAEGEKLQAIIGMTDVSYTTLLAANRSVQRTVDAVSMLEMYLQTKLSRFESILAPFTFSFKKVDADTGLGLGGAVFELINMQGERVATATSGADGKVTFIGVPKGNYSLSEIQAPKGYRFGLGMFPVQVIDRNNATIVGQPAAKFIASNRLLSDLTVMKINAKQEPLAGGVFELEGPDGTVTKTSDADGRVVFPRLEIGSYQLTETTAPIGYQRDSATHTVQVFGGGDMVIDDVETTILTVTNPALPS